MIDQRLFETLAVDPSLMNDVDVASFIKYTFGMCNGRLVAEIPRGWKNLALSAINLLDDDFLKKKLKNSLQHLELSGTLIPKESSYDPKKPWDQVLSNLGALEGLQAAITNAGSDKIGCYSPEELDSYLSQSSSTVGAVSVEKMSQPSQLVALLDPFLRKHKRLVLINRNQFLMTNTKEREVFKAIFERWFNFGGLELTVVRSAVEGKSDYRPLGQFWGEEVSALKTFFEKLNFSGTFKFLAVDDEANRLHERYFLGIYCGIHLGYGLEMTPKPQSWSLMTASLFQKYRQDFLVGDVENLYRVIRSFRYVKGTSRTFG